ncbi:SAICAR synthase-like protein [Poronia punctata]|nr:SAICAR synthase-like protein [Poronia punctata]
MAACLKRSILSASTMAAASDMRELKRVKTTSGKPRGLPSHEDLVDYKHAVAGHDGTMCDADGELFVKPCTQAEVDFYESANRSHPEFADLMPVYCGSLALLNTSTATSIHQQLPELIGQAEIPNGLKHELMSHLHTNTPPVTVDESSNKIAKGMSTPDAPSKPEATRTGPIKTDRAIALLNASYGFKKPNIMDAKMGKQLWSKDASQEKKERFDKITENTTHKHFGFRIAGMQVYKGTRPTYSTADGKQEPSANVKGPNEEGFLVYNKFWGRDNVKESNLEDSLRLFIFNEAAGIDEDLGKLVAGLFARDLRRVEDVLQNEESRMYSSSLLFVFEGDGTALREAIEKAKSAETEAEVADAVKRSAPRAVSSTLRVDSGIGLNEEELALVEESVSLHQGLGTIDGDDDGDDDDFDELSSFPNIYTLKMIDFAHADWTPGLGPDEDVLLGVRSLARIFEKFSD